jgi:predicted metal-binding protein
VVTLSKEKMIARINKLIQYAFADKLNKKVYADKLTLFQSKCMLYLSLHLAIAKERTASLQYLFAAIKLRPFAVFDRRFLGIMKTLIVNI